MAVILVIESFVRAVRSAVWRRGWPLFLSLERLQDLLNVESPTRATAVQSTAGRGTGRGSGGACTIPACRSSVPTMSGVAHTFRPVVSSRDGQTRPGN